MLIFLALLAGGAVATLVCSRRPAVPLMLPLVAWLTVHTGLSRHLMGGVMVHAAVPLVLGVFMAAVLSGRVGVRGGQVSVFALAALVVPVVFGMSTAIVAGAGGGLLWLEVIMVPFLWLGLLLDAQSRGEPVHRAIVTTVLGCALLNTAFVVQQQITGTVLLFPQSYEFYWWWRGELPRPLGLMDTQVLLGMLVAVAAGMLNYVRRTATAVVLGLLYLLAVVMAAARTSIIITGVILVVLILGSRASLLVKGGSLAVLGGGAFFVFRSEVADLAFRRFSEDRGSGDLRLAAFAFFRSQFSELIVVGRGAASGSQLLGNELESSLENGWLIWIYEYGLVATLVAVSLLVALVTWGWSRDRRWAGPGLAAVAVIQAMSFSSTGASSTAVALLLAAVFAAHTQPFQPVLGSKTGPRRLLLRRRAHPRSERQLRGTTPEWAS